MSFVRRAALAAALVAGAFAGLALSGVAQDGAKPAAPKADAPKQDAAKPDAKKAARFLKAGGYYWNGGLFLFEASQLLSELEHRGRDID